MLLENPSFVTILPNIGVMLAFSIGFVLISLLVKTKKMIKSHKNSLAFLRGIFWVDIYVVQRRGKWLIRIRFIQSI